MAVVLSIAEHQVSEATDILLEGAWYWTETCEAGDGEGAQEKVYRHRAEREVTAQVWRKADGEIGYTLAVDGKPRYTEGGWEIDAAWTGATPEAQMAGILTDIRSAWGRWQSQREMGRRQPPHVPTV